MSQQPYRSEPVPPPPGWYPDPSAVNTMRYWDGRAWGTQSAPMMPAMPPAVVAVQTGPNHLIHLILTLITCGLWAPVWLLIAVFATRPPTRPPSSAPMPKWAQIAAVVAVVVVVAWALIAAMTNTANTYG